MRKLILFSMMFIFVVVSVTDSVSACTLTLTTDKDVYAYGEGVTASLYSNTCYFVMMYYYVFDGDGNMIKQLDPDLVSNWPQQIDYYWDQTDSQGKQVPPGTYEIADVMRNRSVTFPILGIGKLYALSFNPTGTPTATSTKIAELIEIDLATCAGTKIGNVGAGLDQQQWSSDISFGPGGTLWAVNGASRYNNLIAIDTDTGAGTVAGSTGTLIEGIAFDAGGIFYAADSGYNNWDNNGDKLAALDPGNLNYTEIGLSGYDIDGLAMAPDGTLYGVDSGNLLQVDKTTGAASFVGYLGGDGFYAVTFGPDGTMYGAYYNGDIYIIDPGTAEASFVFSTGFPYMVGLEFASLKMPTAIDGYIQGLPGDCFKNNADQRKNAFDNKLIEVQALIDAGDYQEAIDKLTHDIRPKLDGEGKNDWITCASVQDSLTGMIDALITYLEGLI